MPYFVDHLAIIGEQGVEVKIDESKFGKRKFHRGRVVEAIGFLGGWRG